MESRCYIGLTVILLSLVADEPVGAVWSDWGDYGNCTEPCGGGIANKTRTCMGATHTCVGVGIRYRVCNTQPCEENVTDMRAGQCKSYNNVSLHDNYYHWVPFHNDKEPCALFCRALETGVTLKVQPEVLNGTVCGPHSGGVCIAGKCRRVGCDGVIGSKKKLDSCGVCGGQSNTCGNRSMADIKKLHSGVTHGNYQWEIRWSPCSANCDAGKQTGEVRCLDVTAMRSADESLCDKASRPVSGSRSCPGLSACRYRWHIFPWTSCSKTCGKGTKHRRVICVEVKEGKEKQKVSKRHCKGEKPSRQTHCNHGDCPEWLAGPWSQCTAACGYGEQKRKVACKTRSHVPCDEDAKPQNKQKCYSGRSCEETDSKSRDYQQDSASNDNRDNYDDALLQSLMALPRYDVGEWGACSVTCGSGHRTRKIVCRLQDKEVPLADCTALGTILPHSKRNCHEKPCTRHDLPLAKSGSYSWQHTDFGACSASCGRGQQRTGIECVDKERNIVVLDHLCFGMTKPEVLVRVCNPEQCPPSWKVGEYSECSAPCGGGTQRRDIDCVQVTTVRLDESVPLYRCPDPIPLSERSCNHQFCQAEWVTGNWGECSVTCGYGVEERPVFCVKSVASGLKVNVSDTQCFGSRPSRTRQCHLGDCYANVLDLPEIKEQNGTYIQIKRMKTVTLKVGERAVLLPNQAVKIKCPVKNFQKQLIFWTKNNRLIPLVGRVRVSSNGALKIRRANPAEDAGVFTCVAGFLQAKVKVAFQSKRDAKKEAMGILDSMFERKDNESFLNRPLADGMFKDMDSGKYIKSNSIDLNSEYDYSSFTMTNWSQCSASCGWGQMSRVVTCNRVTDRYIRLLPDSECLRKGITKPPSVKKCRVQQGCPDWHAGDWSACSSDNCKEDGLAMQKRPVYCTFQNGTRTKLSLCNQELQPETKNFCENKECKPVWQASHWSQCQPSCGTKGHKLRMLTCVWTSTKLPAYEACRLKSRPTVKKTCKPRRCVENECVDHSRYCSLAGRLKMCRYHKFRRRCCDTCRRANLS